MLFTNFLNIALQDLKATIPSDGSSNKTLSEIYNKTPVAFKAFIEFFNVFLVQ